MTFLTILKIVPWVLSLIGGVIGLLQRRKIRSQNSLIELKDKELHSLRDQIVNMVELQGDKNIVKSKVKKSKKKIDAVSDEQLGIDYAGKLSDKPKRTRKK